MNPSHPYIWHALDPAKLAEALDCDLERGLDEADVGSRRERYGWNKLAVRAGEGPLVRFLRQMHQPLVYILNASALISAVMGEYVDAGVIFGVVLVNALMGFFQESRALGAIAALSRALVSEATVLRGGIKRRLDSAELVPGDLVVLNAGDRVPADARILHARGLTIEEAALTGESVPTLKTVESLPESTGLADRRNMAFGSTLVVQGTGTALVVATGSASELGRISHLIDSQELLDTPLTRKLAGFSMLLLWVILGLAALTMVVGVLRGESWLPMFMAAVALAVGAIPEGLPAALTITLAIGVARMARRRAIVRKLPAVETLGSTTVICSDKTGTLTMNEMSVREVGVGGLTFVSEHLGYAPTGGFRREGQEVAADAFPGLLELLRAGALCNDAELQQTEDGWQVQGDPTEAALLTSAAKAGLDRAATVAQQKRLDVLPFESEIQLMATLHEDTDGQVLYVKGSVERLLPLCVAAIDEQGRDAVLDHAAIHAAIEAAGGRGLRVLVMARRRTQATALDTALLGELTYLGYQAMSDPPRPEAVAAVAACRRAGIQIKMITGDHLTTATAIAAELGILDPDLPLAEQKIDGAQLTALDDAALDSRIEKLRVFARVAPEQKLRLVKALQARGHVVAMTGDGTNDAPALRRGDIGVAMGRGGTEVSREAADMVLTDDNFASIEAAVEEGRGVYDNLVKFIAWTLPTNIGMGLVIMAAVFSNTVLPILPVQILWINMTTVILLGLTLAFEPMERTIMERPPRPPNEPILTGALVFRIVLVGVLLLLGSFGLFHYELGRGLSEAAARTTAANVFVIGELFYLFNCRSLDAPGGLRGNPLLLWGCGLMLAFQLLYTYLPIMHTLFQTAAIDGHSWLLIIACGAVIYPVVELEKRLRGKRRSS